MAVYTSGTQVGKKEDLSSIVKDITPNDVPFVKSLSSEKATNRYFQWVDKAVATGTKPQIAEGADVVDANSNLGRTLRTNYTEIFAEAIEVSTTADATSQAGMATLAERIADKVKLIQRYKEQVFLNGQAADGTEASRNTASAQAQIDATLFYDKNAAAMTKAFLDTALQDAYTAGADIDTVYCVPSMKRKLSTLLTFAAVSREAGQGKVITDSVDIYQSDFGDVNIVIDRHLRDQGVAGSDILLADSSMWVEHVLVPMSVEDIAKTGLSTKKLVHTEVGLKHANFKGSACISEVV